jgi:CheY-like chemotaxis protein
MPQERLSTILMVDDAPHVRDSVTLLLRSFGYQVATAGDGQEALDFLKHHPPPSLIVLDLCTPRMNGLHFREEQLRDPGLASIPVIVASSEASEETLPGIVAVFPKGTSPMGLVRLVQAHCPAQPPGTTGDQDVPLGDRPTGPD